MNIILLSIWVKILLITLLCIYYHFKILNKFVVSNTPVQSSSNILCQYDDIPTATLSSLAVCKVVAGITTYSYSVGGVNYEISPTQQLYSKVCSGFCIQGISTTGDCKQAENQKAFEQCEALLKPKQGCVSSAKPVLNVTNTDATSQDYYAVSPINSINSCS